MIQGNTTVVTELVRSGYRSIDAKNESGQTAVHLAALLNRTEILRLLIDGGGNVNIKDDADLTPLHVSHVHFLRFFSFGRGGFKKNICENIFET